MIALGITIAAFTATRMLVTSYLRPRYLTPATAALKPGRHRVYDTQANWTLSQRPNIQMHAVKGHGHVVPHHLTHASCHLSHFACLAAAGVRQIFTFQPATHYWIFQGIEAALYLILAAALLAVSVTRLARVEG